MLMLRPLRQVSINRYDNLLERDVCKSVGRHKNYMMATKKTDVAAGSEQERRVCGIAKLLAGSGNVASGLDKQIINISA